MAAKDEKGKTPGSESGGKKDQVNIHKDSTAGPDTPEGASAETKGECPSCGMELTPSDVFCGICGTSVAKKDDSAPPPASPAQTRKEEGKEPAFCKMCGKRFEPSDVACGQCEEKIARDERENLGRDAERCSGCRYKIDKGWKHCMTCGAEIPIPVPKKRKTFSEWFKDTFFFSESPAKKESVPVTPDPAAKIPFTVDKKFSPSPVPGPPKKKKPEKGMWIVWTVFGAFAVIIIGLVAFAIANSDWAAGKKPAEKPAVVEKAPASVPPAVEKEVPAEEPVVEEAVPADACESVWNENCATEFGSEGDCFPDVGTITELSDEQKDSFRVLARADCVELSCDDQFALFCPNFPNMTKDEETGEWTGDCFADVDSADQLDEVRSTDYYRMVIAGCLQ